MVAVEPKMYENHTLKTKLGHSSTQVFSEINAFTFHNNAYLCLHVARWMAYLHYNLASIVNFRNPISPFIGEGWPRDQRQVCCAGK